MELKQHLLTSLSHTNDVYLKDLAWIPADKFDVSPMGAAKTPRAMTLECSGLYRMLARMARGEEAKRPSPEERAARYARFTTLEAVREEFRASAADLIALVEGMGPADFEKQATAPWGEPMSLGNLLYLAISHTTYHDGQLNYIQSLYGDDKFHWMED